MTAFSQDQFFSGISRVSSHYAPAQNSGIEETYWGYVLTDPEDATGASSVSRAAALLGAVSFALAALTMWLMPGTLFSGAIMLSKAGLSLAFVAIAITLFRYSEREAAPEIQIDTGLGEIREVARTKTGRQVAVSRISFGEVGGIYVDRSARMPEKVRLLVRIGNSARTSEIARGPVQKIEQLRDRLGRDILQANAA